MVLLLVLVHALVDPPSIKSRGCKVAAAAAALSRHRLRVHVSVRHILQNGGQETTGCFSLADRNASLRVHSWQSQAPKINFVAPQGTGVEFVLNIAMHDIAHC